MPASSFQPGNTLIDKNRRLPPTQSLPVHHHHTTLLPGAVSLVRASSAQSATVAHPALLVQ